jgi:hypothetical protein
MVDNQHRLVKGYRDLSEDEIAAMNDVKSLETAVAEMLFGLDALANGDPAAGRWVSLARTNLETGFMYAVKSVARPDGGLGRKG